MTFREKLSAFCARWITPHDAASIVSKHGAEARRMTATQKSDAVHAELRAFVQASKARSAG